MQNGRMTNPTDGINESNKKLRAIYEQLCCINSSIAPSITYNEMDSVALAAAGTQVFTPGTVHSFAIATLSISLYVMEGAMLEFMQHSCS